MTRIPNNLHLPRATFELQRSLLAAHVEAARDETSRRSRFALAVALAALAVVVITATALGVRALVLDKGFVGLPPDGAIPSTPESAQLVARLSGRSTTHGSLLQVYLYTDGRLIWARHDDLPEGANPFVTGFLEQRLTEEGVKRLRSRIVAGGLFDRDVAFSASRLRWGAVDARVSGRLVHVEWHNRDFAATDPGSASWVIATPEQEHALQDLDAILAHPTDGLPASAWKNKRIRAYVPSAFSACWESSPAAVSDPQSDPSRILSLLPPAARNLLAVKVTTRHTGLRGWAAGPYYPSVRDCARVTMAEARSLATTLDDAGIERTDPAAGLLYAFDIPGASRETAQIQFEPLLPHGESTSFRTG